ncbi:MAG: hypothetical protein JNM22_21740 [Saprospiraceae bacterium]|nr:hypothetical protein [Saprospiraceae bacterium]
MLKHLYLLFLLFLTNLAHAQDSGLPLQAPTIHLLGRMEVLSGIPSVIHPEIGEISRRDAANYARSIDTLAIFEGKVDRANLQYIYDDNNECLPDSMCRKSRKSLLKYFYRTPANFFEVNTPDFTLRANPMFNFQAGDQNGDQELLFQNQRGLEVRGTVDDKVYFYTNLVESQMRFPDYVTRRIMQFSAVPGAGFYKNYRPRFPKVTNAYDFNVANAVVGFHVTRHVGIQLGHGRNAIGNGYRSLFLSDVGNPYFFLKINTRVWRFQYQNLFMELSPGTANTLNTSERIPRKYAAVHYLNYKVTPRLAFGFFEATIFNRSRDFEFQYLNPVILYRTVEGMIGSPDNVQIGVDGHWNLFNRVQLYGQFLLDEFIFSQVVNPAQDGWWGNKFAFQTGIKYYNALGINNLDVQLEYNSVRPYTYSHFDSLNSFTHYSQPLAHPLWSNFREMVALVRYQPLPRLTLQARLLQATIADDPAGENWGNNPLLSNASRAQEYGNEIGQGIRARLRIIGFDAAWMLHHNLFIEGKLMLRHKDSDDNALDLNTRVLSLGIRMNMWNKEYDF